MILPDVNLLVYSIDETSPFHRCARVWWESVLSSTERVGLCYPSILGFIRLVTNRRLFEKPLTVNIAIEHVEDGSLNPILCSFYRLRGTGLYW